jgi:hypothetical protein
MIDQPSLMIRLVLCSFLLEHAGDWDDDPPVVTRSSLGWIEPDHA